MTSNHHEDLGRTLWNTVNYLRGTISTDDFSDYILSIFFLKFLSDNYEKAVERELGSDYPNLREDDERTPLSVWYEENTSDVNLFEKQMRKKMHYIIEPKYLWRNISNLAETQSNDLLQKLENIFKHIEEVSFGCPFKGLFSEINLNARILGQNHQERNKKVCVIINKLTEFTFDSSNDNAIDAFEYLIDQFARNSSQRREEFFTERQLSTLLAKIVVQDNLNPGLGKREKINKLLDFACGTGSLLLKVRNQLGNNSIGKIYGQEKNIKTYNLARMNMILHGVKSSEFEIFHGDSLLNEWKLLNESNPTKRIEFDAIVSNPTFGLQMNPLESMNNNFRFRKYGLDPKVVTDLVFLLHGFHYLSDKGTMAILTSQVVLFRGGSDKIIRTQLISNGNIDTVIGLPSSLSFSSGIPICLLVLKKSKKEDNVLYINASTSENYEKGIKQNHLHDTAIDRIVKTYRFRKEERRYSRRVPIAEIETNDFDLNVSKYVDTSLTETKIDLEEVNKKLQTIDETASIVLERHNQYLKELGLRPI